MKALRLTTFGHPPSLADTDLPIPEAGQIRLRIVACGLNFADLLMIDGRYQERPALPFTLGMEVAGVVEAHGPNVTHPAIGCRVAVFASQGGLAEYGCFSAEDCLSLPDDMSFEQAAAFQIAYGTSHLALTRRAMLESGETLLVTGAAGGVGLTAVEIGKSLGARVIAVARGAEKLAVAKSVGADHLIDSDCDDLAGQIKALGGVDVAYETIGGDVFNSVLRSMRPEGRLLTIGFAGGQVPQIPANVLLVKNITVTGLYWGGYARFAPQVMRASLAELLDWFKQGRLAPHVSHILPLTQAIDALSLLRDRKSVGKIVVRCDHLA